MKNLLNNADTVENLYSLAIGNLLKGPGVVEKKHLPLLAGAVALAAVLAGCTFPVPEPSEQTASPSVIAVPPSPDDTAAPVASPSPTIDGYVDAGRGLKIPAGGTR